MDAISLLTYALSMPGAWRDEPWEGDVVAKVADKIFLFTGDTTIGVKCGRSREEADVLCAEHPEDARPMPYLARYGWNQVGVDGSIGDSELRELVDDSYDAVVARLPRSRRP